MKCDKEHRYNTMFENLPDDQGGNGRHKCAGCAYEKGRQDALSKNVLTVDLNYLPESQAGTIRHKSPIAAYAQGLLDAIYGRYNG